MVGGEITELPTGLTDIDIYDISPQGSELLIGAGVQGSETAERPVWAVSLPAGTPRRIGGIKALWACWAPDGIHFAYASKNAIYLANRNGTDSRKLADTSQVTWKLQFSPDGTNLRFDGYDAERNVDSIWQMSVDEKDLRSLLPGWHNSAHIGTWTADGKYFFFNTRDPATDLDKDVWVLPTSKIPQSSRVTPAQLTSGPLAFGSPVASSDGKSLFVLGTQSRAQLVQYDAHFKQFVPFLGGISASDVEVSRDGQWVAYVAYPDLTLWRSRSDGSEKLQLTFPPIQVKGPRWSPDGTRLAFTDVEPGKVWKIKVISANGGAPEEALPEDPSAEIDPSWSPDGSSIVFGRSRFGGTNGIQRADLKTHLILTLPNSEGFFGPRLSPDGHYVAAFPADATKLMLYDFQRKGWRKVASGIFQFSNWSRDSKNVYMLDKSAGNQIVRFSVIEGDLKHLLNVTNIEQGSNEWIGLTAEDSPILVLDKGVTDVYRLDLLAP